MPAYLNFQLRLRDVPDPPWREILVRSSVTFEELHHAIQAACGWEDRHLYAFRGGRRASEPVSESEDPDQRDALGRSDALVAPFFRNLGDPLVYEYDRSEPFELEVVLQATLTMEDDFERRITGGHRAFPREDCGGIPGYIECIRVARGGSDPELLTEWLRGWQPDQFELDAARQAFDR